MAGARAILGDVKHHTLQARRRARGISQLPMEERLEALREMRLDLLAAVDAIEKGLALAAAISHTAGTDL